MKKALLLLGAAATIALGACSSPEKPAVVARKFTESMARGKVQEAKQYSTESTKKMLDLLSSMGATTITPDYSFKLVKDSTVDDTSWITYINEKGERETMQLAKVDGKWLVSMQTKK